MKLRSRSKDSLSAKRCHKALYLAPAAAFVWTGAHAQEVFIPPVEFRDRVTTVEQASTNWLGSASAPPLQAPATGPNTRPLQVGPVRFHPHLGYQVIYGDGILQGEGNPQTTVLHTITPGAFLELGPNWNLDLTASINRYSNAELNNNEGYYLSLRGHVPLEKWLLDFGYLGNMTEQPQVETGGQTLQNTHVVTASGVYNYQTRLSLELSALMDARLAEDFSDYWTWSTLEWLNYQATSKTTLGLGAGAGYNFVDSGPDWTFEQVQGRVVWLPAAKLSVQATAGVQFQQFNGESSDGTAAASGTETFPLFGAAIAYRLFEQTSLSLSANHTIGNAYEDDRFSEVTIVDAGVRQRLFEHISLDVVPAYNFRKYKSSLPGLAVEREDEYFSIYCGLSTVLFQKLNVAVFYQYTDNDSDDAGLSFVSRQVGARIEYRY